jgi:RNA polymerase sigma-70 factor (ECF subfamily)
MAYPNDPFLRLLERHGNELRLHCYRMLGSSQDNDDMLQETLTRAWRAKDQLNDEANSRAWLYRIATNVCLDELGRRRRRRLPSEAGPPTAEVNPALGSADPEAWLEPCPDAWLGGVATDPGARYEQREGVALAFVAALHHLTPIQRATLLLRDVVGLTAAETAETLELGLEATNSALFRARAAVRSRIGTKEPAAFAPKTAHIDSLLDRYLRAWNDLDIDVFVELLHDEVATTMPPAPTWIAGHAANVAFYRPMFAAQRKGSFRAFPTAANGQAAFAFYRAMGSDDPYRLRAIQLVDIRDDKIVNIDHFMLPGLARTFALPEETPREGRAIVEMRPCVDIAEEVLLRVQRS